MEPKPKNYTIFHANKIKGRCQAAHLIRHCERSGKVLPSNVNSNRQHLNQRFFPEAYGSVNAFKRWRKRLGKGQAGRNKTVRKNAVVAVEVLLGMSYNEMTPERLDDWIAASVKWAEENFGGHANVIAGATNLDETTPHIHMMFIPIDEKGRLNCRKFLGGGAKLTQLHTSYAKAMAQFGLSRGEEGSRRKHIPIRQLQQWNRKMDRDLTSATNRLDEITTILKQTPETAWASNPAKIRNLLADKFEETKKDVVEAFEMAKHVLIAQDYIRERDEIINKRKSTEKVATDLKVRADDALKKNAALVRGIDLLPLATDILTLNPITKGQTHIFSDDKMSLEITGRKFVDAKNSNIKGSGAIDLVCQLTGRNFKAAVEYLLTRQSVDLNVIATESARPAIDERQKEIQILKPEPRILTLDDVPPHIWKPVPAIWPDLRQTLAEKFLFSPDRLQYYYDDEIIWATSPTTIAFRRDSNNTDRCGVTLIDIADEKLTPRILVPGQRGHFFVGSYVDETDTIVAVANPIEAISYWEIFKLNLARKFPSESDQQTQTKPMVVSIDAELPNPEFCLEIKLAKKNLKLATHSQLRDAELAQKLPLLYGPNGHLLEWVTFEMARQGLAPNKRHRAWTDVMMEQKLQIRNFSKDASPISEMPPLEP